MKIITANRAAKYESCQCKWERYIKKKTGLIGHHQRTKGNEQTAEYKKIEDLFKH